MSSFTCEHGDQCALFGEGGGRALADEVGVELLGQVPIESAVSAGGDAGEARGAQRDRACGRLFPALARTIVTETVPPVAMAGCSTPARRRGSGSRTGCGADGRRGAGLGLVLAGASVEPGSASKPSSLGRTTSMRPSPSRRSFGRIVGGRPQLRGGERLVRRSVRQAAPGSWSSARSWPAHPARPAPARRPAVPTGWRWSRGRRAGAPAPAACDEEPRVEPPSFADGRDPVADVVDVIRREAQPFEAHSSPAAGRRRARRPVGQYRSSSAGSSKRTGWPSGWRASRTPASSKHSRMAAIQ